MSKRICVFGDSIAWGADDPKGGWAARLQSFFWENWEKGLDYELYNLGICGDSTKDLLARFDNEAEARKPDIIIFAIGINDARFSDSKDKPEMPLQDFTKNIIHLIKKAGKFSEKIIFIGLTEVDESKTMSAEWDFHYSNEMIEKYDKVIKDVCLEKEIPFLEIKDALSKADLPDGLHPDSAGHEKMFLLIKDFLTKKIIKQ
ncbi:MAG: SGNH/GDSL hydrolase family protein [Patescibacteria group bacterium]